MKKYKKFISGVVLVQSIIIYQLYFNYTYIKSTIPVMCNRINEFVILIYQNFLVNSIKLKNYLLSIDLVLSNRQLAIFIWAIIVIAISMTEKKVRKSLYNVIKIFFSKKLLILWISSVVYNIIIILSMRKFGLWNETHLKVTVLWLIFVGFIMIFNAIGNTAYNKYFINIIVQNIKVTIIFNFIVNLYSYSLITELIIVFFTVCISAMTVIIEYSEEISHKKVSKFLNAALVVVGLSMFWNSTAQIILNFNNLNIEKLFILMTMESVLSILFIPFLIFVVALSAYEVLFIRLSFKKTITEEIRNYLYFKIILVCKLDIFRIKNFVNDSDIMHRYITNKEEVYNLISYYKDKQRESNNCHLTTCTQHDEK